MPRQHGQFLSIVNLEKREALYKDILYRQYLRAYESARLVGSGFIVVHFNPRSAVPIVTCMLWPEVINELNKLGVLGPVAK